MATLEKFKYFKQLSIQYCKKRFGLFRFLGLALLLVVLGASTRPEFLTFIKNLGFVFISLFIFRWIDDAWSFYLDRIDHPDRFYIQPENFRSFILIGSSIFILYLAVLFLNSFFLALTILFLFLTSTLLYIAFHKNRVLIIIIPILKYPVFIWCISNFSKSNEILFLALGAFLIMITIDIFQIKIIGIKGIVLEVALLFVIGILVMQPWIEQNNLFLDFGLVIVPILFLLFKKIRAINIFPIIFYPIAHIIDILF